MKQIPSDVMIGFDMAAGGDVACAAYFEDGKLSNVVNYGSAPVRWPVGVEVTELVDGAFYFAPPGDFSKVDFSACRELGESVNFAATQNQLPPKSGQVTCNIECATVGAISEESSKRIAAAISRRLSKAVDYGSYMVSGGPATGFQSFARMGGEGGFLDPNQARESLPLVYGKARIPATKIGELPRIDFEVEGDENGKVQSVTRVWINGQLQPMSSKADTKPNTAQQQAKPALPSLMTEAGERYQGLGWCDE